MKQRVLSVLSLTVLLILSLRASFGQSTAGWTLVDSIKDKKTGVLTIHEANSDGRKRTTTVRFFPDGRTENFTDVTVTKDGIVVEHSTANYDEAHRQNGYSKETFDASGRQISGENWDYPVDKTGAIEGLRVDEKWNPTTQQWRRLPYYRKNVRVRIAFHPSRSEDAYQLRKFFEAKGLAVDYLPKPDNAAPPKDVLGKLFFHDNEFAIEAESIAAAVSKIEVLVPTARIQSSEPRPPDYYFVLAKRRPIVRLSYSPSRRSDADKVVPLLTNKGFTVKIEEFPSEPGLMKASEGELDYYASGTETEARDIADSIKSVVEVSRLVRQRTTSPDRTDYHVFIIEKTQVASKSINWYFVANDGQVGDILTYLCPANGGLYPDTYNYGTVAVWGTDLYTGDSRICAAAVHAGLITLKDGGTITIAIRGGGSNFQGSSRNGVTSADWKRNYNRSFVFVR